MNPVVRHSPDNDPGPGARRLRPVGAPDGDALDLLVHQDRRLARTLDELDRLDGSSFDDSAAYGRAVAAVMEDAAAREAAITELARHAGGPHVDQLLEGREARQARLNRVEEMARGVRGADLNIGQPFDDRLRELTAALRADLEGDEARIAELRDWIDRAGIELPPAAQVVGHAVVHGSGAVQPWYARVRPVSWALSVYDRARERIGA